MQHCSRGNSIFLVQPHLEREFEISSFGNDDHGLRGTNNVTQVAILHLMNEIVDSSISRIVERLVRHLGNQGYSWHIGGLRGLDHMHEEFTQLGAQVVDFSEGQDGMGNLIRRIREYVGANRIKVVHTHTPRTILTAAMALASKSQTIHLTTKHNLYRPGDRRWGLIYTLVDRFGLYLPEHLVTVSKRFYREIAACPGLSTKRLTIIRNGIDSESYYVPDQRDSCRLEFALTPDSELIAYTGRIVKAKRLDLLLEGFSFVLSRHPHARLMIVGEGELRPKLEVLASSLGISHAVIFTGFRQDIPRLLAAMDVYIQPSANEGLSLSILEAMAAEKPVIVTDVGGAREIVTDRRTGILIPPESSHAIGTAIADLLDDPDRQSTIARAARSHVIQEFGIQQMMESYRQLYEMLVCEA